MTSQRSILADTIFECSLVVSRLDTLVYCMALSIGGIWRHAFVYLSSWLNQDWQLYVNKTNASCDFPFPIHSRLQTALGEDFIAVYNLFYTSLPVLALGFFDQDVKPQLTLKVCHLLHFFVFAFSFPHILSTRCSTSPASCPSSSTTRSSPSPLFKASSQVCFSSFCQWVSLAIFFLSVVKDFLCEDLKVKSSNSHIIVE